MYGPNTKHDPGPLSGCDIFTLRANDGSTRRLVRMLRADGARASNLAPLRLVACEPATIAEALPALADASHWLFISPAAVRIAARLSSRSAAGLFTPDGALARAGAEGRVFAPGPGTAKELADHGIAAQIPTERYDTEGLLALPGLSAPLSAHLVLVGAPDGRGLLQPSLQARGARVNVLHVYERRRQRVSARQLAALAAACRPLLVASSGAMLDALVTQLDERQRARILQRAQVVVASERLREHACTLGFRDAWAARSARPADLHQTALTVANQFDGG